MRNIIITGGELFNKGAQAMTFVTVDECRKRFPNHDIFLLSPMDYQRTEEEKIQYRFKIMGWYPLKFAKAQNNYILKALCYLRNKKEYNDAVSIYKKCDAMIDISGYALGDIWGYANCNNYLEHIEYAMAFKIPLYIMPQSFGPFNFQGKRVKEFHMRIERCLNYAKVICAREQSGYDALKSKYGLKNVVLRDDLVLNNKQIDLKNIYRGDPNIKVPTIMPGSIAIVPNVRTTDWRTTHEIVKLYSDIINIILEYNEYIYIVAHASADLKLCEAIKKVFLDEDRVILLDKDYNCIEYTEIIKDMKFIIASRFHSIVHAYKMAVPCIAIGWAEKYANLLRKFHQEKFYYDVRSGSDAQKIGESIEILYNDWEKETEIIKKHLSIIQKENVFDVLNI